MQTSHIISCCQLYLGYSFCAPFSTKWKPYELALLATSPNYLFLDTHIPYHDYIIIIIIVIIVTTIAISSHHNPHHRYHYHHSRNSHILNVSRCFWLQYHFCHVPTHCKYCHPPLPNTHTPTQYMCTHMSLSPYIPSRTVESLRVLGHERGVINHPNPRHHHTTTITLSSAACSPMLVSFSALYYCYYPFL